MTNSDKQSYTPSHLLKATMATPMTIEMNTLPVFRLHNAVQNVATMLHRPPVIAAGTMSESRIVPGKVVCKHRQGHSDDDKAIAREGIGALGVISRAARGRPQLRNGSDLSRVTLPTFILETRSFLERFTDFMLHPQFILGASEEASDC